jgi:N-acetylglucosaminyldiphosphoundecaprenol N-acetyl-beta-D-mannosaminyltransferase
MHSNTSSLLNVSTVRTIAAAIRTVDGGLTHLVDEMFAERSCVVSFVNAHAVNLACDSVEFFDALMRADVLLRDGLGVKILLKAVGRRPGINMNGTDFIPVILAASQSKAIAVYGSTAEIAKTAANVLKNTGSVKVTHCDGFQSTEEYVARVHADRPRVVILGMGMPKQELVANAILKAFLHPILIVNGGAILDFVSGRLMRAPVPVRRFGLEWFFRLLLEPRRLWRRYLVGNAVFLARVTVAGFQRNSAQS